MARGNLYRVFERDLSRRLALLLLLTVVPFAATKAASIPFALPELTQTSADAWLNSPPLTREDLRDHVVLLDFWTFECWNCYRSFPWLKQLEKRLEGEKVLFLGIHSPEFAHERERSSVEAKIREFGLTHPVMMDNDFAFWRAMDNQAWPAFYLVDKSGRVRYRFYGETHDGDTRARAIEQAIDRLLDEPDPPT